MNVIGKHGCNATLFDGIRKSNEEDQRRSELSTTTHISNNTT